MKKLHTVLPPASEIKFIGDEPEWPKGSVTENNYIKEMMRGLNWHNYVAKETDFWKYMAQWVHVHANHHAKVFESVSAADIPPTIASIARMQLQGFPLRLHHLDQITSLLDMLCAPKKRVRAVSVVSTPKAVPDVQKTMRQQVTGTLSDIDDQIDNVFETFEIDPPRIADIILSKGHTSRHLQFVVRHLTSQLEEWTSAYNKTDEQLQEGYGYVPRRKFKHIIDGFTVVLDKVRAFMDQSKPVRKARVINKTIKTKYLKFLTQHEDIVGESPTAVVGATALWIYDTKYRKIIRMIGEKKGLSVKGSSITGVMKSETKMLRWPDEQLRAFLRAKGKAVEVWYNEIKTKNADNTGRIITKSMILLRVE